MSETEIETETPTEEESDSNMSKTLIAKKIARFAVGRCVSGVIVTAAHNITPTHTKTQKVQLDVGAYVVGAVVADATETWTDAQVDLIIETFQSFKHMFKPEPLPEFEIPFNITMPETDSPE